MVEVGTKPLRTPELPVGVDASAVMAGKPIPAIERIRLFSSTEWEDFILEWADSLRKDYDRVDRCGGSGDMGRDIVAAVPEDDGTWDNYQCKHYDHPLWPSDVWVEFGKLMFFSFSGAYTYPRSYYFVAPQGAGTKLSNLLRSADALRSGVVANWDSYCRRGISTTRGVGLEGDLKEYVAAADFSIFESLPPLRVIEQHAKTRWHVVRFGGGLPGRPEPVAPPENLDAIEARYVRQLLDAYGDYLGRHVSEPRDLAPERPLSVHFEYSRLEFYSAESLRAFSRDTLPPGKFEELLDEVQSGILDEVRAPHPDGYRRLVEVVKLARCLQITAHPLSRSLRVRDRGGMCHQLANEDRVRWVDDGPE